MYKPFILKDRELILNQEEALLIPEYKKLVTRDNPTVGDTYSKKRLMAFKEFTYIYIMCDYDSMPNQKGFSTKDANEYALEIAGLPSNWKPDADVKAAMKRYISERDDVSRNLVKNLLATFRNSSTIVETVNSTIHSIIQKDNLTKDDIKEVIDYQKVILGIAQELPVQYNKLTEIEEKMSKVMSEGRTKRGGAELSDSADPDSAIG